MTFFTEITFHSCSRNIKSYVLTDPEESIKADGHPVGQQLLHHRLCSAERKHTQSESIPNNLKTSWTYNHTLTLLLLTVAASVWGSWPHTAPPGRWGEFWGCRWNTPVCRAAPPSAGRPRRPCLWERKSAGSPECEWTEKKIRVANYPSAQNIRIVLKPHSTHGLDGDDGYLGEEEFTVEQVGQLHQALLHRLPPTLLNIQVSPQRRLPVAREENALSVLPVVKERDARAHQITGHVHHLCHQVWVGVREGERSGGVATSSFVFYYILCSKCVLWTVLGGRSW